MQVDLKGKTALVTGAAQGIGRAIALAMAANGANVIVNDLPDQDQSVVDEVRAMGAGSVFMGADIGRPDDVERLAAAAVKQFGVVDILVNNAGLNTPGP